MKEGTRLSSAVNPLIREKIRQVAADPCDKEDHVTKKTWNVFQ